MGPPTMAATGDAPRANSATATAAMDSQDRFRMAEPLLTVALEPVPASRDGAAAADLPVPTAKTQWCADAQGAGNPVGNDSAAVPGQAMADGRWTRPQLDRRGKSQPDAFPAM